MVCLRGEENLPSSLLFPTANAHVDIADSISLCCKACQRETTSPCVTLLRPLGCVREWCRAIFLTISCDRRKVLPGKSVLPGHLPHLDSIIVRRYFSPSVGTALKYIPSRNPPPPSLSLSLSSLILGEKVESGEEEKYFLSLSLTSPPHLLSRETLFACQMGFRFSPTHAPTSPGQWRK